MQILQFHITIIYFKKRRRRKKKGVFKIPFKIEITTPRNALVYYGFYVNLDGPFL